MATAPKEKNASLSSALRHARHCIGGEWVDAEQQQDSYDPAGRPAAPRQCDQRYIELTASRVAAAPFQSSWMERGGLKVGTKAGRAE